MDESIKRHSSTPKQMTREEILDWLSANGSAVGAAASSGDATAKEIMQYYSMWHRSPGDPGSQALTSMSIQKFRSVSKGEKK